MGIGSKIYKFIHQKAVFLCHESVYVNVCRWQRENVSKDGGLWGGGVHVGENNTASLMVSAFCKQ